MFKVQLDLDGKVFLMRFEELVLPHWQRDTKSYIKIEKKTLTVLLLAIEKATFKVQLDRNRKMHFIQVEDLKKTLLPALYWQLRKLRLRSRLTITKKDF